MKFCRGALSPSKRRKAPPSRASTALYVLDPTMTTSASNTFAVVWKAQPTKQKRYPLGVVQFWLQRRDRRASVWLGNRFSDLRFWWWKLLTREGRAAP